MVEVHDTSQRLVKVYWSQIHSVIWSLVWQCSNIPRTLPPSHIQNSWALLPSCANFFVCESEGGNKQTNKHARWSDKLALMFWSYVLYLLDSIGMFRRMLKQKDELVTSYTLLLKGYQSISNYFVSLTILFSAGYNAPTWNVNEWNAL